MITAPLLNPVPYRSRLAPVMLLTLFGCCSGTPYETRGVSEENQNNLRTKMGVNPAQYRRIPEQYILCSCNTMIYTTIPSGVIAGGFGPCSRFVRELFGFHWEGPEESRRNPEQIQNQYATRSEAKSKPGRRKFYTDPYTVNMCID
jgi:hypothetical protein